jgi:CheY-like chemotaxis protein
VSAESPGLGRGSIFTICLPLPAVRVAAEAGENAGRSRIPNPILARLDGLRALVVDDETDAREAVTAVLEASGARVVAADGVTAALDALAGDRFDAMISDIGMPGQDGYALIHRLREMEEGGRPRMAALALTAYANRTELRRMLEAGFDASLIKPIDAKELIREVARLVKAPAPASAESE